MYPRINLTDSISISTYSLLYIIAIIIGIAIAYKETKRYKLPLKEFPPAAFWAILCGIIGAKVFHVIFSRWDDLLQHPLDTLFSGGGWMYYGAEIGGLLGLLIYLAINRLPVLRPLDIGGIVLMLAHSVGRLGCFCAGCCHGIACDAPWAVKFPHTHGLVHPTQLYESIPLFIGFLLIWKFRKKFVVPGTIFATYLVYYSSLRFFIEFYRADIPEIGILNLTPSQYIASMLTLIAIALFSFVLYYHKSK